MQQRKRISSCLHSLTAGMTLALFGLACVPGGAGEAQAATNAGVPALVGEVEFITVNNPADKYSGGTMVVGGQILTIPANLLIDLPADRLTLQELFVWAPTACKAAGETGLAKTDHCNTYGTGANASISANRTSGGNLIAGDVFIQKGTEALAGEVTYINYDEGYFRLGGTVGNSTNGVMVRLNDPDGRHTVQKGTGCKLGQVLPGQTNNCSPDLRFNLDLDNYINVFTTGYPACIPSTKPRTFIDVLDLDVDNDVTESLTTAAQINGTGDLLCPTTNRTVNNGLPVDDSRLFAPIMLGDHIVAEGNWEIIQGTNDPAPVRFLSAHSTMTSVALTTKNLPDQPDYMFLDEVEVDAPGFNNQRVRSLFIGFVTLVAPTADVNIWSLHYDQNNDSYELPLASAVGCDLAGGAGTCTAQGLGGVAGNNVFKIRHDVDFNTGAKPKLNPCAHLIADPRMAPGGIPVCNNNPGGLNIGEMLGILSPMMHEIQARTGHELENIRLNSIDPVANPLLKNLDINGFESTHGQYLFPFGMNLGGISTPEFTEIDLNAVRTPILFTGIPWNLDRRLGPGGCDGICESTPQPLDPFPFEGLDPRTQANLPSGPYNDPVFTATPLSDVRNRMLSFVTAAGKANGNATVLDLTTVVNPAAWPIANTPIPAAAGGGGANQPPVFSTPPITAATVGSSYLYDVNATDAPGDTITYSLTAFPATMTINPASGLINWTPSAAQAPLQPVLVQAMDPSGAASIQAFVVAVNAPPVIASTPTLTAQQASAYNYPVVAFDLNGGGLTYSLPTAPAGMAISGTGQITWTPSLAQVGVNPVTVRVTDATSLFAEQPFSVTVTVAPPTAPVITSTPSLTAPVGVQYQYQVVATDVNGGPFTYLLTPTPGNSQISATGLMTWTPTNNQKNTNPNRIFTVTVTDSTGLFTTQVFTINIP